MPTLLREGPYRFFFYSDEGDPREPPHVHVTAGERLAKFWLEPVALASSRRLRELAPFSTGHLGIAMEA